MRVTLTPIKEKNPTEDDTERITSEIPNKPSVNLDPVNRLRGRRGKRRGAVLESTDSDDEVTLERVKKPGKLRTHCTTDDITPSSATTVPLPNVKDT
jgi:hypothetical protein